MKNLIVMLFISFYSIVSFGQLGQAPDCMGGKFPVQLVGFMSFDIIDSYSHCIIDTSYPNNIWQIGTIHKIGIDSLFNGNVALVTDTLNDYPINNESAAIIYNDYSSGYIGNNSPNYSMTFWHYYDTDTLKDSCIFQATIDSGKTWLDYSNFTYGFGTGFYYSGTLNNYTSQPYLGDKLWWSGKSNGWQQENICVFSQLYKGQQISKNVAFRFLFKSDSLQNNKFGWMIDNVTFISPQLVGEGIQSLKSNNLNVYPNPNSTGLFTIDYPSNYVKGSIEIYNQLGQKVKEIPLSKTINIADLPKGIYYYAALFDNTQQRFTGVLMYQ